MDSSILFYIIAFFAEIIGTVVGFGSSTTALPLSLFLYDFDTALVLVAILHVLGNGMRLVFFKDGVDWNLLARFGIPSVIFTVIGALLIPHVPQDILKGVLGIFIVVNILLLWTKHLILKPSRATTLIGGSLSGLFAGLIGMGGAMKGVFLENFHLTKEKYIATAAAIGVVVDLIRIPIYLDQGLLRPEYYSMIPPLIIIAIVGTYIGSLIVRHTKTKAFHFIVQIALLLVGLKFIADFVL